jgi:hypothetical protein
LKPNVYLQLRAELDEPNGLLRVVEAMVLVSSRWTCLARTGAGRLPPSFQSLAGQDAVPESGRRFIFMIVTKVVP